MMKRINFSIVFGIGMVVFAACNSGSRHNAMTRNMEADQAKPETSAPNVTTTDVTKMIREANMRFRVKEVQKTTSLLEKMAVQHGGYVSQSIFDVDEDESIIKKISSDSAEEIKKLNQRNHMEILVLNTKLDSFLDQMTAFIDHLEFRHVTASDMAVQSTSQPITEENKAFAVKANSASLQKKFARVSIDFYQTPIIHKWIIPNPDSFDAARGGFWNDFSDSFKTGLRGTGHVFNYIVSFWSLGIFALLMLWLAKRKKLGFGIKNLFKKP